MPGQEGKSHPVPIHTGNSYGTVRLTVYNQILADEQLASEPESDSAIEINAVKHPKTLVWRNQCPYVTNLGSFARKVFSAALRHFRSLDSRNIVKFHLDLISTTFSIVHTDSQATYLERRV